MRFRTQCSRVCEKGYFPVTSSCFICSEVRILVRVSTSRLLVSALMHSIRQTSVIGGRLASSRLSYKCFPSIVLSFRNPHSWPSVLPKKVTSKQKTASRREKSTLQFLRIDQTPFTPVNIFLSVIQLAAMKSLLTGRDEHHDFCKCQLDSSGQLVCPSSPSAFISPARRRRDERMGQNSRSPRFRWLTWMTDARLNKPALKFVRLIDLLMLFGFFPFLLLLKQHVPGVKKNNNEH